MLIHSNLATHNNIRTLLRRRPAVSRRPTVEIVILCPESGHTGMLSMECTLFYNWLVDMHHGWIGDVDMHVLLRPMSENHAARVKLQVDFRFWNEWNPPSALRERKWSYEVGEWLETEEFEGDREEREKY
jgi:hypothetical protein